MIGVRMGNIGWGWEDVRPYFEKSERRVDPSGNASGNGALDVKDVTPFLHPMRQNWLNAAAELSLPVTDISTALIPRAWLLSVTIRDGKRWSAAHAFSWRPALRRAKCAPRNARLGPIRFASTGVVPWAWSMCETGTSILRSLRAEVIPVRRARSNSPQLLQLSGHR